MTSKNKVTLISTLAVVLCMPFVWAIYKHTFFGGFENPVKVVGTTAILFVIGFVLFFYAKKLHNKGSKQYLYNNQ